MTDPAVKIDRKTLTPMERAKKPGISGWRAWGGTTKQINAARARHHTIIPLHAKPVL